MNGGFRAGWEETSLINVYKKMKKLFALFALAGAFVACQPEEIETAFEVKDAVVRIYVSIKDVNTGADAVGQ